MIAKISCNLRILLITFFILGMLPATPGYAQETITITGSGTIFGKTGR